MLHSRGLRVTDPARCPSCQSADPLTHYDAPSEEVRPCRDPWHGETDTFRLLDQLDEGHKWEQGGRRAFWRPRGPLGQR
jgi:hypothetical protein